MTHNFTILNDKKYFSKQFEWIERQIKSFKTDSFVDFELASIEIKNGALKNAQFGILKVYPLHSIGYQLKPLKTPF